MPRLVRSLEFVVRRLKTTYYKLPTTNWRQRRQGFTIIELLIVITIIAILSTIGFIGGGNVLSRIRDSHRIADVNAIKVSLEGFYEKNNKYPPLGAAYQPYKEEFFTSDQPQPWIPEIVPAYSQYLPKDPKQTAQNTLIRLAENILEKLEIGSALAVHENPLMNIDSGTYIGTGIDNKKITLGFKPDMVLIKGPPSHSVIRTSTMAGDSSKHLASPFVTFANAIKSLDNEGFTLGTDPSVNCPPGSNPPGCPLAVTTYYYLAVGQKDGQFAAVSYQGNGTDQNISVGFAPDMVFLFSGSADEPTLGAVWRTSDMTAGKSQPMDLALADNMITAFGLDGFSVGADNDVNKLGITYHAIAIKSSGAFNVLTYKGNNIDDRIITGAGFKPDSVWIKGDLNTAGSLRFEDHSGTLSSVFDNNSDSTNWIKALELGGFKVGNSGVVNGVGSGGCPPDCIDYFAAVWKETTFGAPQYFYLYNVSADRKTYNVWATLENKKDPGIYDHTTAACKAIPPVDGYNYCGAGF